ncbi:MAG TPA: alpha/beta hydrolase [Edaphobacter sp.]|nr:alpha/beta hydrolase [Edaphobacter sp.]
MSLSRTTLRLITVLFLLAGILLLRKPVFGQAITAAPTRFSVVIQGVAPGKGPDVILIPGLSSSRDVYSAEAKLLTANYRLHLIQIAGFAGDPAGPNATGPILAPVVEQLHQYIVANKLQHPAIVGHSLGGLLGLMLADTHPEDVGKLLIVDSLPFYALVFAPEATVDTVTPQAVAMRDQMLAASPDIFAAIVNQTAGALVLNPEARKLVAANSIASDRTVMTNAMYEDLVTDLRPRLAAIKTPTTLLYPFDASAVGPDSTKIDTVYTSVYSTMPNLNIHRIDDSRHFIMYDQPAAFDKAVQLFLKP